MIFQRTKFLFLRASFSLFALLILGTSISESAILVEERFSHPDGNLVGQTPSPGPGNAWSAHDDLGGTPIQVSSGAAVLSQGSGSGGREDVNAGFSAQSATDATFARFDFTLPSGQDLNDPKILDEFGLYFAHFYSGLPTTGFRARTGIVQPSAGGDFGLAINASGSRLNEGSTWPSDLSFDTTYRTVISYDPVTAEGKLWLDPVDVSSAFIANTAGGSFGTMIEGFALRQSNDYEGTQIVDNLVVATTFEEALAGSGAPNFLAADFNEDTFVDATDLTTWSSNYGLNGSATKSLGDADSDMDVDGADFLVWQRQFGQSPPPSISSVPEPTSLTLLIGFAVFSSHVRRRFI
ncbi:hypothetical protein [Bythopirellula polymerisocia]|uniref:PEP-CTERM protein-sorting domain-containing protein n=1 Tax=Bythopirellula polymerisocia TaxID=2528003 RepID=A0A5C6CAE0_9BACT|nr:hypothetical protein [Bythopirellula polymerisocia]TWU20346.1 hypothetical protein Pla144_49930 [Bythopirellula polymerisocia]